MNVEPSSGTPSPSGSGPPGNQRKERGAIAAQVSLDRAPSPAVDGLVTGAILVQKSLNIHQSACAARAVDYTNS